MCYIGLDYFAMLCISDPIENQSEINARWQLEQIRINLHDTAKCMYLKAIQ